MSEADRQDKLKALEERIEAVKRSEADTKAHQEEHYSQANLAWRMVTEMVSGLGIGFGIGYGLDVLFGTTPFLMVLFTLLGIAAGIKVMLRSAQEIQRQQIARQGADVEQASDEAGKGDKDGI
ncbi:AtpZ/AtpI family protein [Pacificoceanicola onchidii]|uniref:AtpZ/AtpI family protein n=1 Tax=Pacificoceanicola onchidii TaxID=2562685 RepID=UPI0010A40D43|nr:AtpZ/AtpI family protein [Pacificoceanicola onchidii]